MEVLKTDHRQELASQAPRVLEHCLFQTDHQTARAWRARPVLASALVRVLAEQVQTSALVQAQASVLGAGSSFGSGAGSSFGSDFGSGSAGCGGV